MKKQLYIFLAVSLVLVSFSPVPAKKHQHAGLWRCLCACFFLGLIYFPIQASVAAPRKNIIENIELFLFQVNKERYFSFGTYHNRQHIFIKIQSGDQIGWSEQNADRNNPDFDLEEYAGKIGEIKGKTIPEAFALLESNYGKWDRGTVEVLEMALLDLKGRLEGVPAVELLGLKGRNPVPGLFCILEEDLEKVEKEAKQSLQDNFKTHIKLKIFGKEDLDVKLINKVREVMGPETYITADVNTGYKDWKDIAELTGIMKRLHQAGLNACEDPAELEIDQWIQLQSNLSEMSVIPDYIMRPAWVALEKVEKGMGNIYNLHPHSMGSIKYTIAMAGKIKEWGAKLMIGDASLIGPACTQWIQIAIGLEADWVEAIEKNEESDKYLPCVVSQATYRTPDGKMAMKRRPGFGLELDEKMLKKNADKYYQVQ